MNVTKLELEVVPNLDPKERKRLVEINKHLVKLFTAETIVGHKAVETVEDEVAEETLQVYMTYASIYYPGYYPGSRYVLSLFKNVDLDAIYDGELANLVYYTITGKVMVDIDNSNSHIRLNLILNAVDKFFSAGGTPEDVLGSNFLDLKQKKSVVDYFNNASKPDDAMLVPTLLLLDMFKDIELLDDITPTIICTRLFSKPYPTHDEVYAVWSKHINI